MTENNQKQLGKTLWAIADQLRGAMNADDFRDYMLAFLFLRYLSDNYEQAAKKELGRDYPDPNAIGNGGRYAAVGLVRRTTPTMWRRSRSRCAARRTTSSSPSTSGPASPTWPARRTANCSTRCRRASSTSRTNRSQSTFSGLFSEINLGSEKLGKTYADRNAKLCTIITKIAEGLAEFSTDSDTLGDAYEYLIGQFAAGSGKKAGEFYTPQQISRHPLRASSRSTARSPKTGKRKHLASVLDFACGSGSLLLNVRNRMGPQAASARSTGRRRTSPPTTSRA